MKPLSALWRSAALLLTSLAILSGCGGGGGTSASGSTGTLSLSITDQPACGYDNVFVTVTEIRVHKSADAEDGDAGWQSIPVVGAPKRIDLLELTNGVLEELGQTTLPAGKYTQMRLILASNGASAPYPNALVLTGGDGTEIPLTTPSAQQTGIKMNVDITVEADKVADFVLDFDACKSIVKAGSSGKYLLKPVVSVIPVIRDAGQRIIGYLGTATLGAATTVSAQSGGNVVKSTPPDATGKFVLYPVPAGTYDLVITSTGKATAVMTGVPVADHIATYVGSDTVRIGLTGSAVADAYGVVTLNGSPAGTGAMVRALQTLAGGPTIEVAAMPADADTGEYLFTLPTGSPQITTYAANATAIAFLPDSTVPAETAAGKYTVEASIEGLTAQTAAIDLLLPGYTGSNFTFVTPSPAP